MERVNISFADDCSEQAWLQDKLAADAREELMDILIKHQQHAGFVIKDQDQSIPDELDRMVIDDEDDESSNEEMDRMESPYDMSHVERLETANLTHHLQM